MKIAAYVALGLSFCCAPVAAEKPSQSQSQSGTFAADLLKLNERLRAETIAVDDLVMKGSFTGSVAMTMSGITRQWVGRKALPAKREISLWRWASVSKQVTAVLVLQEVAKGTIDLDQPVSRYLPGFKSANARKLSVRQLLRHQSGLPNPDDTAAAPNELAAYYAPGYKGNRDPQVGYCATTVKGEPGGNWSYNNCDYIVAGALLESVTATPYAKLVKERIAKPIGAQSIGLFPSSVRTVPGQIAGKPEPKIDFAAFGASGALYGSLLDLLAFDQALMSGKLLPKAQLDMLWDGQPDLGFIALGQWVFEAPLKDCAKPVRLVERRGAIGGVQVRNFIAPDIQAAVVAFTDKGESDFDFGEIWQGKGFSHDLLNAALCPKAPAK